MSDTFSPPSDLTGKAKEVVRDVKAKGSGVTDDLTRVAKDNAAQLGETARQFANSAKDKVGEAATQRKSVGADYINSIAQATGQAAQAFDSDLPQASVFQGQHDDPTTGIVAQLMIARTAPSPSSPAPAARRCGGFGA